MKRVSEQQRIFAQIRYVVTTHYNTYCYRFAKFSRVVLILIFSNGNAFVSGAGGLRFKYWADQIERSVAKGSPPLRHFF